MNNRVGRVLLVGATLFSVGCPLPLRTTLEQVVKDYQTPKSTLVFETGSGIAPTTPIVISFTETIDTATLVLSGSMAPESDGGTWSKQTSSNDTLTISPKTAWSKGSGKTLTMNCANSEGYAVKQIALTYGVLDGVVYVRATGGSDGNPGTSDLPKLTIQEAIDTAAAVYATAEVHVAAGTYQPSSVIDLKDGISLFGGYDPADWTKRETNPDWAITGTGTSAYPTVIQTSSNVAALRIQTTSHPLTVDGFTISGGVGGSGNDTTAIYCSNSTGVVIQSNSIDGGGGDLSVGVTLDQSAVALQRNTISGQPWELGCHPA